MPHLCTVTRTRTGFAFIVCTLLLATACGKAPVKAIPAASVANGVPESQLAIITLTSDAVRRLGINTTTLDSSVVALTRTVGGEVVVPSGQSLVVAAPFAGTVLAIANGRMPATGESVVADQPLMRLIALPPDQAILRTAQDLQTAEARFKQAGFEADRVAGLFAERLVASRDQERAQADLAAARAALDAANAQQRLVSGTAGSDSRGLGGLVIAASSSGAVRAVHVGTGQSVAAGAPLVEIVRLNSLWIRVPVYAGDAALVERGAPASVQVLGNSTVAALRATPVSAPPSADALASSVDLFYGIEGVALRPGERVLVTLPLIGSARRALTIPNSAIVRDMSGGSWVYAQLDSLRFARQRVEITSVVNNRAVLSRGPASGTRVVIEGAAELFGTEFGTGK